ncbi:uncharacterized protein LOC114281247 isoform X1 [Camellia sinensis]|uniref:uncharacterized protein LOC114281247 isoform X1 n=1 Tax=Camellia sinensis TaxID=4442 RepID=UPI001035D043|nr:uncharacterized protein LOC114281247 isoform X1 [Camellia sinensis]
MWQVMLAAAVAGSGFFAKRFLNTTTTNSDDPNIEADTKCDQSKELQQHLTTPPSKPQLAIHLAFQSCNDCKSESETQSSTAVGDGSIFMFSSPVSKGGTGSRFGSKKSGGNREGFKISGFEKVERKCGGFDQSKSGKKFAVCLKKRRTSKNSPGKCESCSSKDNSTFSWGLGVGIMCMMSAGKAEISRLNTAVDETTKVVQELKTEFSRRKSSRNLQVSSSKTEISTSPYKTRGKHTEPIPQSSTENRDNVQDSGVFVTEDGECASSVLTEEPQQEVLEMDRLEAELESELQKLPWCSTEASGFEGKISDICENEDASFEGFYKPDGQTSDSCQLSGVLPSELDQKLCHLLIEQQESQIVGLESELHLAQSKLHDKEAELQALKDCVKRLTEFSLATASDEESEAQKEEEKIIDNGDYDNNMGPESKRSVVGMKRSMDFEPYSCDMK